MFDDLQFDDLLLDELLFVSLSRKDTCAVTLMTRCL